VRGRDRPPLRAQFGADAEQRRDGRGPEQIAPALVDAVLQPSKAGCVGGELALENDRKATRHDKPVPGEQHAGLPGGDLAVIFTDQPRALRNEQDTAGRTVIDVRRHPLDQFRAFQAMRETGMSEEEIAAAFFVSANVVKQRLKLTSVSEPLLDAFAGDEMNLDQLMAFTVNPDHTRQEQVWEAVRQSYNKQPYQIRRMLTEDAVRAADKRVQFVGIDAYVEAGGSVMRDLFESDDGGWLQDVGLVDMLVTEKLNEEAEAVRSEGWKWIEVGLDFPYGHTPFAVAAE